MSKAFTSYLDAVPRWALVALAAYGVIGMSDLHKQIKEDHQTVIQHSIDIRELKEISKRLAVIAERTDGRP